MSVGIPESRLYGLGSDVLRAEGSENMQTLAWDHLWSIFFLPGLRSWGPEHKDGDWTLGKDEMVIILPPKFGPLLPPPHGGCQQICKTAFFMLLNGSWRAESRQEGPDVCPERGRYFSGVLDSEVSVSFLLPLCCKSRTSAAWLWGSCDNWVQPLINWDQVGTTKRAQALLGAILLKIDSVQPIPWEKYSPSRENHSVWRFILSEVELQRFLPSQQIPPSISIHTPWLWLLQAVPRLCACVV